MITSLEQARDVQAVRAANGKRGWSKAVRRYLQRKYPDGETNMWYARNEVKQQLPHLPVHPEPEPVPEVEAPKAKKPRKSRAKKEKTNEASE